MYKEKTKLVRHEKRLLERLKTWKVYSSVRFAVNYIFSFKKIFLTLRKTRFWKTIAMASVTFIPFLWRKLGYIDNVIVHKKQRRKWLWKRVMNKTLEKLKSEKADYAILISKDKRKISHKMYKKMWFVVVSLWLWVFAYKRIKSKKWFFSKLYEKLFNF